MKVHKETHWEGDDRYLVATDDDFLYSFSVKEHAESFVANNGVPKIEHVGSKCQMSYIKTWKENHKHETCCDKAFPIFCVCKFSTACDVHGQKCVGSHE